MSTHEEGRVFVSEIPGKVGEEVVLKGWVDRVRKQGGIAFF